MRKDSAAPSPFYLIGIGVGRYLTEHGGSADSGQALQFGSISDILHYINGRMFITNYQLAIVKIDYVPVTQQYTQVSTVLR